ncbi:tRNA (adenosine(37)-N6)-threonylcarbamoyltransferase complex ATPase subunit type 1 TsaE [Luteirhabdus pelagi]|jgi:tRNA threonylcarbamoyladenosine biosynthesis protein TsaE|uniref:tRNA (adenosine(37)-N6)-threonylcarbamoyltransferase complex ATPase subunit type 1 TsaE n=1 Tax=Luteirhabdus pelagi TaxID=2792783 RepID=UPI00193A64E2|nr:tRNA (adenosine(37)-N6)-threonylcarbamoyltransferase complex ATPase subunit type 1 TsaE [Luteirhabdus pelagi]
MQLTYQISDLSSVAQKLLDKANSKNLLFYGKMGVGKTTLIKELVRQLGVAETVSSPTFSLVNEYSGENGPIYHFDFYRLNDPSEALDFGVEEYFMQESWNLVEWPEKISGLLPDRGMRIEIKENTNGSRTLNVTPVE